MTQPLKTRPCPIQTPRSKLVVPHSFWKGQILLGSLRWLVILIAPLLIISGCGGGKSTTTTMVGPASSVTLSPSTLSLDFGQVSGLSVSVADSTGNRILTVTPTFQSSNTALATVSTGGLVCAGTWDSLTTPVVCTPATASGTVNITATASSITSSATVVSVHPRIASLTISAPAVACTSDATTRQFSAIARNSAGVDITSSAGTPFWSITNTAIATVDANGLATAKQPGVSTIFATLNGVNSLPATFITCPPASISIITPDAASPNAVTLAAAATSQLTATATDTLGQPMPDIIGVLLYSSSLPASASVTNAGLVAAIAAGNAGIVASCTPPICNSGGTAVYSNLVKVNVSGTSASTVYVTGNNASTIIPIDTTTNTAGTAITIPLISSVQPVVNSFVFNKAGTRAFVGTASGLLILDSATNIIAAPIAQLAGTVLAVSPNGIKVIIAQATQVFVLDTGTGNAEILAISGATAADYAPDSSRAFILAGNKFYVYPPASPLTSITLAAAATDIKFLSQGSAAYLAGGSAAGINVRATCDLSSRADIAAAPAPLFLASTFDSTHVVGVNTSNVYDLSVSSPTSPCPPTPVNTVTAVGLGAAPAAINQLVLSPDGTRAFVLSNLSSVLQYTVGTGTTPAQIALTGGSATTGGATLDSKNLYVGISGTNTVQRIDTSSSVGVATAPISVPLGSGVSPDFVVVRPK